MEKIRAVEIRAELRQIKTMADGTVNVTINLPEDCREQTKVMLDWLGMEVQAVIVNDDT
jgi:ribosomal protein L1